MSAFIDFGDYEHFLGLRPNEPDWSGLLSWFIQGKPRARPLRTFGSVCSRARPCKGHRHVAPAASLGAWWRLGLFPDKLWGHSSIMEAYEPIGFNMYSLDPHYPVTSLHPRYPMASKLGNHP